MPILADLAAKLMHSSLSGSSQAVERMETGLRRSLAEEDPKEEKKACLKELDSEFEKLIEKRAQYVEAQSKAQKETAELIVTQKFIKQLDGVREDLGTESELYEAFSEGSRKIIEDAVGVLDKGIDQTKTDLDAIKTEAASRIAEADPATKGQVSILWQDLDDTLEKMRSSAKDLQEKISAFIGEVGEKAGKTVVRANAEEAKAKSRKDELESSPAEKDAKNAAQAYEQQQQKIAEKEKGCDAESAQLLLLRNVEVREVDALEAADNVLHDIERPRRVVQTHL